MSKIQDNNRQIITTREMHTGGEPLRIMVSGLPEIKGQTILDKRQYCKDHLDDFRRFLMHEPRGHKDMYGAILVEADDETCAIGVLFIHNEGYSTMCGHGVIALGRYVIDQKIIMPNNESSLKTFNIQCPCGPVKVFVESKNGKTDMVKFHSVPAFVYLLGEKIEVDGLGLITIDIVFGGAFYAFVIDRDVGLDLRKSTTKQVCDIGSAITRAVKEKINIKHPESEGLSFLYGTIITDGKDDYMEEATMNCCVFADSQVDRSPCGSGATSRIALQYAKSQIKLKQTRRFQSSATKSEFTAMAVQEVTYHGRDAVIVEVGGRAYYSGSSQFEIEDEDPLKNGFLVN